MSAVAYLCAAISDSRRGALTPRRREALRSPGTTHGTGVTAVNSNAGPGANSVDCSDLIVVADYLGVPLRALFDRQIGLLAAHRHYLAALYGDDILR